KVLFVFLVLAHDRRRVVHVNVTDAPTAQSTAQQIVEAFPWETAPRYLLRDRDAVYGVAFSSRVQALGIREVKTAPRSPWQKAQASYCTSFRTCGAHWGIAATVAESPTLLGARKRAGRGLEEEEAFVIGPHGVEDAFARPALGG